MGSYKPQGQCPVVGENRWDPYREHLGYFWAALRTVERAWLFRFWALSPTYGWLILPHGRFSVVVVPFDYDCKVFFGISEPSVLP